MVQTEVFQGRFRKGRTEAKEGGKQRSKEAGEDRPTLRSVLRKQRQRKGGFQPARRHSYLCVLGYRAYHVSFPNEELGFPMGCATAGNPELRQAGRGPSVEE